MVWGSITPQSLPEAQTQLRAVKNTQLWDAATPAPGTLGSCLRAATRVMGEQGQLLPTVQRVPGSRTLTAHRQHPARVLPTPAATQAPSPAAAGALSYLTAQQSRPGLPLAHCHTSALPNNAQAGKRSRPNAVNELIHEGYWRTKGAQTAQGHVTLGACFATLTFPWVQAARAGGGKRMAAGSTWQQWQPVAALAARGISTSSSHFTQVCPPPAALGGHRRAEKVPVPLSLLGGCRSHSSVARTVQAEPQPGFEPLDTGTLRVPGDLGAAPYIPKDRRAAGAEATSKGLLFSPRCPTLSVPGSLWPPAPQCCGAGL